MTHKLKAGVLSVEKLKAYKVKGTNLVSIKVEQLGINYNGLKTLLSQSLQWTRGLHVRLNEWDSIEIDMVEDHINHKIVDVNFMIKGYATHRVLGIKVVNHKPISFESVSIHALPAKIN
ncbi:hypothetical protein [Acinetobacter phage vB_AbaS_TCUP2199]|nr:hypothetical protein [Acinetobacter phage vB_AbaS_TCUP2199]